VRKRDFYAGGLMVLLGLGVTLKGSSYRGGTLMHMGPGFMPTALGIILVLVGIAIAAASLAPSEGGEHDGGILPENPQWFAWFCILLSPVFFIVFGHFGMIPGTFACVFIAAVGDRASTWLSTFVLSAVVTVFGVGLFSYFLQVPLPMLTDYWELTIIPFLFGLAGKLFAQRINRDEREWFVFCLLLPMIGPIPHLFGLAGSALAKRKNRDNKAWFAICFFFSVLGLLLLACLPKQPSLVGAPRLSETTG
jgi:hypothetical protein